MTKLVMFQGPGLPAVPTDTPMNPTDTITQPTGPPRLPLAGTGMARASSAGTTTASTTSTCSSRTPSSCCARSPPSRSARCSCSAAARTRPCSCTWRPRPSGRAASPSRSSTSTPGTTSPRSSSSATSRVAELGERLIVASRRRTRSTAAGWPTPASTLAQPAAGHHAARRHQRARVRCGHRRRPARRGQGAGQRARAVASATPSGSGTPSASAPSCGSSTRAACSRASTCGPSRCRTGPSSTSGTTSPARRSSCRPSTSRTRRPSSSATACCSPSASGCTRAGRARSRTLSVRFRTVGDATCTGAVRSEAITVRRDHRRDRHLPALRAGRHARRRPVLGDLDGGPEARGILLGHGRRPPGRLPHRRPTVPLRRLTSCGSPPSAPSTTASRP